MENASQIVRPGAIRAGPQSFPAFCFLFSRNYTASDRLAKLKSLTRMGGMTCPTLVRSDRPISSILFSMISGLRSSGSSSPRARSCRLRSGMFRRA